MPAARPPRLADEAGRLAALRELFPEGAGLAGLPLIAEMAALACGTPCAAIVLVEEDVARTACAFGPVDAGARPRDQDAAAWALAAEDGLEIADLQADQRTSSLPLAARMRMYAGVPLTTADGHALGVLCVMDPRPRELSPHQRQALRKLAAHAVAGIASRAEVRRLQARVDRLQELVKVDELTGVLETRALMDALEAEVSRQARHGGELAVVLVDIDELRRVNEQHGQAAGDEVLRTFGALLQQNVRNVDLVGRYGGEEFLLVLPHTDLPGAHVLAEILRARLEDASLQATGRAVTASFGVAMVRPGEDALQTAVAAADRALHAAKLAGRNAVMLAGD